MMSSTTMAVSDAVVAESQSSSVPSSSTTTTANKLVQFAECECCELMEECTQGYIERIRERYQGKWICGLCAEAVKDEMLRSDDRLITTEEALIRHINFCKKFIISSSEGPSPDPTIDLIAAMRQILLRSLSLSLDSPAIRSSAPSSPTCSAGEGTNIDLVMMSRSKSCIAASLSLGSSSSTHDHSSISWDHKGHDHDHDHAATADADEH